MDRTLRLAARALRSARKAHNITQLQLANALRCPEFKVSRWETGRLAIKAEDAPRILSAFKVVGVRP